MKGRDMAINNVYAVIAVADLDASLA